MVDASRAYGGRLYDITAQRAGMFHWKGCRFRDDARPAAHAARGVIAAKNCHKIRSRSFPESDLVVLVSSRRFTTRAEFARQPPCLSSRITRKTTTLAFWRCSATLRTCCGLEYLGRPRRRWLLRCCHPFLATGSSTWVYARARRLHFLAVLTALPFLLCSPCRSVCLDGWRFAGQVRVHCSG